MTTMSVAPSPSSKPSSSASRSGVMSRFASVAIMVVLISISNGNNAVVNALNVAVTGATGRVGRLVVDSCLKSGHDVTAIVRNTDKANELFGVGGNDASGSNGGNGVTVRRLDFADLSPSAQTERLVRGAFEGVDRVVWCSSGFVDVPDNDDDDDGGEGGGKTTRKESLDVVGMTHLLPTLSTPEMLGGDPSDAGPSPPSFVMLSSAGVTRPGWDDAKKARLVGCADIPIVNLNPGGILGKKVVAEDMLKQKGGVVPYCIVRPTALKFDDSEWPRGRSLFSQGDVAVGRTNANDLADLLVSLLNEPSATGKTFECVTLAGYPPPTSLSPVLSRLSPDDAAPSASSSDAVDTAYQLMQQLLPGENQDATRLEMGRTYEEVDRGEVARERGAAPTEREIKLASGVVEGGAETKGFRRRIKSLFGRSL